MSWHSLLPREAEADDDVAATIKSVRQQLLNLNITGRLPVKLDPDFVRVDENSNPRWSGTIRSIPYSVR